MDRKQYYRYYYAIHAGDYKSRNLRYKRKRLEEAEPERTPEERKKALDEWIAYMDKKY